MSEISRDDIIKMYQLLMLFLGFAFITVIVAAIEIGKAIIRVQKKVVLILESIRPLIKSFSEKGVASIEKMDATKLDKGLEKGTKEVGTEFKKKLKKIIKGE